MPIDIDDLPPDLLDDIDRLRARIDQLERDPCAAPPDRDTPAGGDADLARRYPTPITFTWGSSPAVRALIRSGA